MTFWNFFFLMLIYIPLVLLWIFGLLDLSRRSDLSGLSKALWAITLVLLPVFGMIIYFTVGQISPGLDAGPRPVATAGVLTDDAISQIEKLRKLKDSGTITGEEFAAFKAKLLV
ncbi:MAG: SHOCT domain-containing protein [Actinomycetota bacterium]|nr:SHOCT domain-containing protein [Actinomycetota bacterium]